MHRNYFLPQRFICFVFIIFVSGFSSSLFAQTNDPKAEAIIKKAVQRLGGERFLQVKNVVATGNYTPYVKEVSTMPVSFTDIISYPDNERTEFKQGGRFIQTNTGETGWIYDGKNKNLRQQTTRELESFKKSMRVNLENFLRGEWREKGGVLLYVGKREASIGRRNDVIKVTYPDAFSVEYEFAAEDGLPAKLSFKSENDEKAETKEMYKFGQFVEIEGVYTPFVIERLVDGKTESRINYITIAFNRAVTAEVFAKPANIKDTKKEFKFH